MTKYTDIILLIGIGVLILLLLTAWQSSEADKAKCKQTHSTDTCEFYIR